MDGGSIPPSSTTFVVLAAKKSVFRSFSPPEPQGNPTQESELLTVKGSSISEMLVAGS